MQQEIKKENGIISHLSRSIGQSGHFCQVAPSSFEVLPDLCFSYIIFQLQERCLNFDFESKKIKLQEHSTPSSMVLKLGVGLANVLE